MCIIDFQNLCSKQTDKILETQIRGKIKFASDLFPSLVAQVGQTRPKVSGLSDSGLESDIVGLVQYIVRS